MVKLYCQRATGRKPAPVHTLSDLIYIGETGAMTGAYPEPIRVGCVAPGAISESIIMFHNPQFHGI